MSGAKEMITLGGPTNKKSRKNEEAHKVESEHLVQNDTANLATQKPRESHGRTRGSLFLIALAVVLLAATVPAVWFKTSVMDADQWVATVAPLSDSPEIQTAVAAKTSTAIINAIDVQQLAQEYLPTQALPLAAPIANSIETLISQQTIALMESPRFASLWSSVNRAGHGALVASLTGVENDSAVSGAHGSITLDVGVLVDTVKSNLVDSGFGIAERIPTSIFNNEIVLFSSPTLSSIQTVLNSLEKGIGALVVAILVLILIAFALSKDRRKVVLWLGMGTFTAMLLSILAINLSQNPFIDSLSNLNSVDRAAAVSAYDIILSHLIGEQRVVASIGLVVGVIALIGGYPALRHAFNGGLSSFAQRGKILPFCQWIKEHKRGVAATGFILVGILLLLPFQKTWALLIGLVIALLIWVMIITLIIHVANVGTQKTVEAVSPNES